MSQTEGDEVATSAAAIAEWLIDRIRFYGQVDDQAISVDAPLTDLRLDSIYAMTLCGDIEDTYDISVDPSFLADMNTLGDISRELSARVSAP
jgi:acyl carrier protein